MSVPLAVALAEPILPTVRVVPDRAFPPALLDFPGGPPSSARIDWSRPVYAVAAEDGFFEIRFTERGAIRSGWVQDGTIREDPAYRLPYRDFDMLAVLPDGATVAFTVSRPPCPHLRQRGLLAVPATVCQVEVEVEAMTNGPRRRVAGSLQCRAEIRATDQEGRLRVFRSRDEAHIDLVVPGRLTGVELSFRQPPGRAIGLIESFEEGVIRDCRFDADG